VRAALEGELPYDDARAVAVGLRDSGWTQRDLYGLFEEFRSKLERAQDYPRYDAVCDVMDCIWGWCSREARLYPTALDGR
jgi:hypothetical protein